MPIYWVGNLNFKPDKISEYVPWVKSEEAAQLFKQIETETKIKYLGSYVTILGMGDHDAEEWFLLPDWASLDTLRESPAWGKFQSALDEFVSPERPGAVRMMRGTADVMMAGSPKPKDREY